VQFQDNFDYQDVRGDYVRNEVSNLELGNKIFAEIIQNEYAAKVVDPRTYASVSRDIMHRWTYPYIPDTNFATGSAYQCLRGFQYIEKSPRVILSQRCKIQGSCIIGGGTEVCDESLVTCSTIGRRCKIGRKAQVINSYIWDDVILEDEVVIRDSIVCGNVKVHRGTYAHVSCRHETSNMDILGFFFA
jgi:translation initiation factor eIF-2B subunit epsilon